MISRLLPTALLVAVLTASQAGALEDFDPIGIAINAGRAEQIARLCGISTRALEQAEIAYQGSWVSSQAYFDFERAWGDAGTSVLSNPQVPTRQR